MVLLVCSIYNIMRSNNAIHQVHPKLRNTNPHNITHSLMSWNLREWMFVLQISLLIVTFLSLISWTFVIDASHQWKLIHFLALRHVSVCGVSPSSSSSSAVCWMLVHAYAPSPRKAKWSGPQQWRWEANEFKLHSVTCYTDSIVSHIHVNTIGNNIQDWSPHPSFLLKGSQILAL